MSSTYFIRLPPWVAFVSEPLSVSRMRLAQIDTLPKIFYDRPDLELPPVFPLLVSRMALAQIDTSAEILRNFSSFTMVSNTNSDVGQAIASVYRSEWGQIVAILIRLVGDFNIAEEAAQEAFTAAVSQWQDTGIPALPRA